MVIRDAIHGEITFTNAESRLIMSQPFQRLRHIKQLGFTEYEYPCATHTRYSHSLGVAKCITDMYNSICENSPSFYREGDLELLRVMALVHDLGHAPFSHASECLSTIEHEERLTQILETLKKEIVIPNNYDIPSWQLVNEVYQGIGTTYLGDKHLMALHTLLDWFVDADKLDYLERDAFHCGVNYGSFDRADLIRNLTMVDDRVAITSEGVSALESFILARYYMFTKIYMSPRERVTRMLCTEELQNILPDGVYPEDTKKFLALTDIKYISRLKSLKEVPYVLIYDANFDVGLKNYIDKYLSSYLLCDCPRKALFRQSEDDSTVMVVDSDTGRTVPCAECSPVLKGIQFESIHRLRYYAHKDDVESIKPEFIRLLNRYYS